MALRPWQVQFLAWADAQEKGPMASFLLADDRGLDKTISALTHLVRMARGKGRESKMSAINDTVPSNNADDGVKALRKERWKPQIWTEYR